MSNDEFNFDLDSASPGDEASPSDLDAAPEAVADAGKKGKKPKKAKAKKTKEKKAKAKKTKPAKKKKGKATSATPKVKTPQFNTYTSMLLVALICLSVACALLYVELSRYGSFPWWKTDGLG